MNLYKIIAGSCEPGKCTQGGAKVTPHPTASGFSIGNTLNDYAVAVG